MPHPSLRRLLALSAALTLPASSVAAPPASEGPTRSHSDATTLGADLPGAWINLQGIGWDGGDDTEPLYRLSHGLGYAYQYHGERHDSYEGPFRRDLLFYYNDPHKHIQPTVGLELDAATLAAAQKLAPMTLGRHPMLPRAIKVSEFERLEREFPAIHAAYKQTLEDTKSWANTNKPFPHNLAQLQIWGDRDADIWEPSPDFQRTGVIERHADAIVEHVEAQERPADGYLFKGIVIDVPELWKEFNWASHRPLPGATEEKRSTVKRPGVTLDHATLQEGWYHFLHALSERLHAAFPDRDVKLIYEPSDLWVDWGQHVAVAQELYPSITDGMMPSIHGDAMVGEKPTLSFLTDERLAEQGWPLFLLGNVTGDLFPKNPSHRLQVRVLGETADRGSNFFAYGTLAREFSRYPDSYAPQTVLIRTIAGWENMHGTTLPDRLFDHEANVYLSPTAVADDHTLAGVHPASRELYGVVVDTGGVIELGFDLPDGEAGKPRAVNGFFERQDGPAELRIDGRTIRLADGESGPVGFRLPLPDDAAAPFFHHPGADGLVDRPQAEPRILTGLFNGGFEDGPDGWYTGDGGKVRVVSATDRVHGGDASGKLIHRTKKWHGFSQRIPDALAVMGPGRYRITAQIQAAQKPTTGFVHLKVETPGGSEVYVSDKVRVTADGWTQLRATFDVAFDEEPSSANLSFRIDDAEQPFYLDDVTLTRD